MLQLSEDGESWEAADVGEGIEPGTYEELVWDESRNDSSCDWYIKATYNDGSESDPTAFDFCEDEIVIEFDE